MDNKRNVIALGKFDGVHIGHKKLIQTAVSIASEIGCNSLVYAISFPDGKNITDSVTQEKIFKFLNVDLVVRQSLTEEFKKLSPMQFVSEIIKNKLNAAHVVVGYNFRFGYKRRGDVKILGELLKNYNIGFTVIDSVNINGKSVSSTRIRELIENGNIKEASLCLGRNYSVSGKISEGKHLGTSIGFPTLNVYPEKQTLIPKCGVYKTKVFLNGNELSAITNVGINPTVENGKNIKIETHILNSKTEKLYGNDICIEFEEFIREEKKFESLDKLKLQIKKDKEYVLNNE